MVIDQTVVHRALILGGTSKQLLQLEEECQELALSIHKYLHRDGSARREEVIDEIADVYIMLSQAEVVFGSDEIQQRIEHKLQRLTTRMDQGKL